MPGQRLRHLLLQKLFWNPVGAALVHRLIRYERMFDTVVRGYSLITPTNGERWLTNYLPEKPMVFDVGFHDGESTNEILALRPQAQVTGFDPSRFASTRYQERFANDRRVTFINKGLSDEPGELEFFDYDNMCNSFAVRKEDMSGARATSYKVPVTTLDAYCADQEIDHIDFMKIDAEGFDLNVLEGAQELLSNQAVDMFIFEFASGWAATRRYLWEATEFVEPLPYKLYHLFNGFLCPLVYDIRNDSCCTLPAMYVGLSEKHLARGDIPSRNYRF